MTGCRACTTKHVPACLESWLEPVVVLIGAGTSVTSGGKTMDNLEHAVLATVKALPKLPADGPR